MYGKSLPLYHIERTVKERNIQVATKLLKQGKLSETEISELLGLTEKQMKEIKEKAAKIA